MKLLATVLICLACLLPPTAHAQDPGTGSIAGTAQDDSGALIPAAAVTVTSASGATVSGSANEKGEFSIGGLAPGTYTVTVSVQGFADFKAAGIVVAAGQTAKVTAVLALAGVSTKVNVVGETPTQVETESSQIAGTVTSEELVQIGLNGRNFTQLIALTPGVSNQTGQDEALVGVKGSVKYSVNGGRVEYNTFDVDGGDVVNASVNGRSSTLIVYPSLDALDQVQVLTSNYGAMYGRSASGTILATTKSGTNEFHGDAYFFARNNIFNSRNYFDQTKHAPLYQKYGPGGTIGGPLYIPGHYNTSKDKTFFFVSEEYRHDKEPVEFNQAVPSMEERNCALAAKVNPFCLNPFPGPQFATQLFGDFSDVCPATSGAFGGVTPGSQVPFSRTYVPGGSLPYYPDCPGFPFDVDNTLTQTAYLTYPGNLVPIDPRSAAILSTGVIPAPTSTSGCNSGPYPNPKSCYVASVSPLTTWREDLVRVDHNINAGEKLYVRYIHDAWSTVVLSPQWGVISNSFPTIENQFVGPGTSIVLHLNSTLTNTFVNDVAMAYTTDHITLTDVPGPGVQTLTPPAQITAPPCSGPFGTSSACGIGYIFNNGFGGKIPGIVIAGNNGAYGGHGFAVDSGYMPWHHSNPTYSPRDDATLVRGKHTLEFGVLAIIAQRNEVNPPVGANTGDLQGIATFSNINTLSTTGNAFADFLTPHIQTYQQDSAQHVYHNNYWIAEPYVQDDWKVTTRLTLNLGVRLSLFGMYHEKNLTSYNWVASQYSSALASTATVNPAIGVLYLPGTTTPVPLNLNNLAPYFLNGIVRCGVAKYANGTSVPASCMSSHLLNAAPRIGFAWDPLGNGKTSIRAGYGIFYEHGTGNEANTGSLEGSPGNQSAGGVLDMTQYYPSSWNCIGFAAAGCLAGATGASFPLNLTSIPTKATWPYVQQWSLSVQHNLPWNMLGSIAYVGSKGTHLTAELQVNQLVPLNASQNPFSPGEPLTFDVCSEVATNTFTTKNGKTILPGQPGYLNLLAACQGIEPQFPLANALRQPGYAIAPGIGQIFSLQNIANSSYNAMQLSLRRTRGPLTMGVSYSYSHSIDDSSDRTSAGFVNAYDLEQNRASSDFDQRHLLNIEYIYDLPVLKAVNWWRKFWAPWPDEGEPPTYTPYTPDSHPKIFQGWQLSGVTLYASGTPFTVVNGGSPNGISAIDNAGVLAVTGPGSYPDVNRKVKCPFPCTGGASTFGPLLGNPAQFVAPEGLTYGNAGRNFLNNPSRLNFDMSLLKMWQVNEKYSLQFRLETFNTFNHTQFRIYDPDNPGNTGNNVISCYAGANNSAGDPSCVSGASFLHPVDAHRPRTIQLGVKFLF